MKSKTVVILGGGIGGLVAANRLRRCLPEPHRVVLVERSDQHAFTPSFLWVMTGGRQPAQVSRNLRAMVRPGVEITHAEVRSLDPANRRIAADSQTITYDYLIIALGAELAPEAIPGLSEAPHTFYTLDGSVRLHGALQTFAGGTVAVVVSAVPYKCPGAPHEGAMLLADFFRRRGLGEKVSIHVFTPEAQPLPVAGPILGEAVRKMLAAQGIGFHPLHKLTEVNPQSRELLFEGKAPIYYDLLVAVPPHRGPVLLREAALANEAGWVPVDPATLSTKHERIYAIGDVTALPIPGRWKPDIPLLLPKAGVFAHGEGLVLAHRIAAEIAERTPRETFGGEGFCALEAGGGKAGFAFGNFFAEPSPDVRLKKTGRVWHLGKVLFEQWWLSPMGLRRQLLRLMLSMGGKTLGIPVIT